MFEGGKLLWFNGELVPWDEARVHVLSHALHYGSSVFEGIRGYKTPVGPQVFRLTDHMQRLYDSAKIYRMPIPYSRDELIDVCKQVIVSNKLVNGAYIRPIAMRGYGEIGLAPKADDPVDVVARRWRTASTSVFPAGSVLRPIRSRPWPKPAETIFRASSSASRRNSAASQRASRLPPTVRLARGPGKTCS